MQEPGRLVSSVEATGPLQELKRQWQGSAVLRMGMAAIALIAATEALHQLTAAAERLNERAALLAQENLLLERQLAKEPWNDRLEEAKRQLQAAQSMVWAAADESLVQAGLQDRLRALATGAGLELREVVISRQVTERPGSGTGTPPAPATNAPADGQQMPLAQRLDQDGIQVWRLRLSAGFTKAALVNFLSELSAQEKLLVTEQLRIRAGGGSTSTVEIELRALSRLSAPGRQSGG